MNHLLPGVVKGACYGLLCGGVLGGVGALSGRGGVDYEKELTWSNRQGKTMKFTNLPMISSIQEDLYEISKHRAYNARAFNEAFRNIQSALTLFEPIRIGQSPQIMSARKMTNYVVRASKAMEAIHQDILKADVTKAFDFEKAMMNITLSLEERINSARFRSKNALPELSSA